mgnify:CR=1 FL=1
MQTFLQLVAQDLYKKIGNDLSRVAIVFPNKRASLFFNEHLAAQSDRPLWSPAYVSISELFRQLSPWKLGDPIRLVCELYKVFREETHSEETLDDFYFWGELLISDFDDVDKNLVDADRLFSNLQDLKNIMDDYDFLDSEQEEAIRQFFQNFSIERRTQLKEKFISLWDKLGDIYHGYRDNLAELGIAYEGMMYRYVMEELQPEKLKDEEFIQALREWKADLQIVVAFRMLPEVVWNMPRLGTFNLHASLLPQYRGAAPINWAVINGDTETGITTFFLKHEIDTGEVIQQVHVPIADTDNVEVVHDKLMVLGGKLVLETVDAILNGTVKPIPQEEMAVVGELRPAPKIFKETCRIDWNQPVKKIYDFIRGLSPYPAAWSELITSEEGAAVVVKIFESEKIYESHQLATGTIVTDGKKFMKVAVPDGFVSILSLQLPGKKRLKIDELLRGYHLEDGCLMK